jgi:predicted metal-dependent phosphoesterase TrpH
MYIKGEVMGLADLHLHTIYSYDGTASLSSVLTRARQAGLNVIAITDHDEIRGALKAVELAPQYGIEVIPGVEITTADGDLLALFVTETVEPGLSLEETVLRVGKLGGICIAPHPMAGGMSMKSLDAYSLLKALRKPEVAQTLIGIEVHNATAIDRMSNHYARILASRLDIAQTGSSDAHIVEAIGLGATQFEGHTAKDLLVALRHGRTKVVRHKDWSAVYILGSWLTNYIKSSVMTRLGLVTY